MPPKNKEPPRKEVEVKIPYRMPEHYECAIEPHYKWRELLKKADQLIKDDTDLQYKVAKGLRLKDRRLTPEVLGRFYCQYCELINNLYDVFLRNVQVQRAPYVQEIVAIIVKRLYELRNELVHYIVNDYLYFDTALMQLRMTPDDIQIVVPYHFKSEFRSEPAEQLLQKMLREAIKRKNKKVVEEVVKPPTPTQSELAFKAEMGVTDKESQPPEAEDVEEEEEEEVVSVHTVITEDCINATLIQTHERFRQFYVRDFQKKLENRMTYFKSKVEPAPPEVRARAAALVQNMYREFMYLKRKRVRDDKRDMLLGLIPDVQARPKDYEDESDKLYDIHRVIRERIKQGYMERMGKAKAKLLIVQKDAQITDVTEEIVEWFAEWFLGYEKFPRFPHELEGGTIIVATGQFPTIDEQKDEDERIRRATMGKTKDQLKEERQKAKEEAKMRADAEKERLKKEKQQLFKARCNPDTDPGYDPKTSEVTPTVLETLKNYRVSWSIYDESTPEKRQYAETVYGFLDQVMMENLMMQLHLECRKETDELMRLELKYFNIAHKIMCDRLGWKFVKAKQKKPPKEPPAPKEFIVDEQMLGNIEVLFDLGIISKPTTKLKDVIGDYNFAAYELQTADPDVKFPPPGYGDIRRRLLLSCIFGSGLEPGAVRRKSVMLLGQPRNGKSFLADAVCGEMNAVKFDISPEVFTAHIKKPAKVLSYVFQAARIFQPSVIFCKNIQKVFYKKVPPNERKEKASSIKKPLGKLISGLQPNDKVIFIGTCSDPFNAKVKPMTSIFNEIIMVPRPDYGSIRRYFYYSLQKIYSMPRDYNVQGVSKIMVGIGFGHIMEIFNKVMTPERICRLNIEPLQQAEFLEYMIDNDIEAMPIEQYEKFVKFWLSRSPLKVERAEYDIINATRASAYERIAKKKAEEEAKKNKK